MIDYLRNFCAWTQSRLRADAILYAGIAVYTLSGFILAESSEIDNLEVFSLYTDKWLDFFLKLYPIMAITIDSTRVFYRLKDRKRLGFSRAFSPERVGHLSAGTVLAVSFYFFQGTFTFLKNAMYEWNGGFVYDRIHADIDRAIHFGVDPWRLFEPLIANDITRWLIEFNYNAVYFTLCFSTLYFVMTSPKAERLRTHYVAVYMLAWFVVGNVMAGLFFSAGPAFYGLVTGDTARFEDMLDHLSHSEGVNAAAGYQRYLWQLLETGKPGFGSGISAFPSVHVALATVNMCFAFDVSRRLGALMTAYALLIFISSVALGWHYAIDGYVAAITVVALYFGLKPLRRKAFRTSTSIPESRELHESPKTAAAQPAL